METAATWPQQVVASLTIPHNTWKLHFIVQDTVILSWCSLSRYHSVQYFRNWTKSYLCLMSQRMGNLLLPSAGEWEHQTLPGFQLSYWQVVPWHSSIPSQLLDDRSLQYSLQIQFQAEHLAHATVAHSCLIECSLKVHAITSFLKSTSSVLVFLCE